MRIIYLHQYFNTPSMPGSTRSYEMARRLAAAGHEVDMITSDRRSGNGQRDWRVSEEAGIRVHWAAVPYENRMGWYERLRAFTRFAVLAGRRAAGLPGDIVFATSTPLTIALPAVYAARRNGIPMVFEVRDLWPDVPIALGVLRHRSLIRLARLLERFAYRNARHVVALSPGMKEGILRAGVPESRVSVIPNGCDNGLFDVEPERGRDFRRRHSWLGDRRLVVYAGALGTVNGVGYLADIAAEASTLDPEIRFLVVGDGKERDAIRARAADLGVLDRTFFLFDPVPKVQVPDILSAADLTVSLCRPVPELWDNSANKVFDSLAARRPAVVNYDGWQGRLLEEAGAGVVIPAEDPPRAAEMIVALLHDSGRMELARERAANLAAGELSREELFDRLQSILVDVGTAR